MGASTTHKGAPIMTIKIGTQFKTRGKAPKLCTVVDIHSTFDINGKWVKTRYIATHDFAGQEIKAEYVATSILMGMIK